MTGLLAPSLEQLCMQGVSIASLSLPGSCMRKQETSLREKVESFLCPSAQCKGGLTAPRAQKFGTKTNVCQESPAAVCTPFFALRKD